MDLFPLLGDVGRLVHLLMDRHILGRFLHRQLDGLLGFDGIDHAPHHRLVTHQIGQGQAVQEEKSRDAAGRPAAGFTVAVRPRAADIRSGSRSAPSRGRSIPSAGS